MRALGLESSARLVFGGQDLVARRSALKIKLDLLQSPVDEAIAEPLEQAWRAVTTKSGARSESGLESLGVVRSSALVEDRAGSSFAGQFESFLGLGKSNRLLDRDPILLGRIVGNPRAPLHGHP